MTLRSYIQEINNQKEKPIEEQLNDLTIAGAKLLQTLDNLLPIVDKVVATLEKEINNMEKETSESK